MATETAKPTLTECRLVIDGLAGTKVLLLNGEKYDVRRNGFWWVFERRNVRTPRLWRASAGDCTCPAFRFKGRCKHEATVATGILEYVK